MTGPALHLPSYRHARSHMATRDKRRSIWRRGIDGTERLVGFAFNAAEAERIIAGMKAEDRRRLNEAAARAAAITGEARDG